MKDFITFDYKTINAGDFIQTIAVEHALNQLFPSGVHVTREYRNNILHGGLTKGTCIMQGWFEHGSLGFYPKTTMSAVWVGTHFAPFVRKHLPGKWDVGRLARPLEIGGRDLSTVDFCIKHGVSSYFSRCLTLTLPSISTHNASGDILISTRFSAHSLLPDSLKRNAKFIDPRHMGGGFPRATKLLDQYRNAKLVVTSAVHCAAPCLAFGVPVVFIVPDDEPVSASRISLLQGLTKLYTYEDLKNNTVDYNPEAVDLTPLKTLLLKNLEMSIHRQDLNESDLLTLQTVRGDIAKFNIT